MRLITRRPTWRGSNEESRGGALTPEYRGGSRPVRVAAQIAPNLGGAYITPAPPRSISSRPKPHVQGRRALRAFIAHVADAAAYGVRLHQPGLVRDCVSGRHFRKPAGSPSPARVRGGP